MLINHNTKQYWWGPMRTGSREVGSFLKRNGFQLVGGEHEPIVMDGYDLFVNCRNPYTRAVSWWKFRTKQTDPLIDQNGNEIYTHNDTSFEEWIMNDNEYSYQMGTHWDVAMLIKKHSLKFTPIPLEDLSILNTFGDWIDRGSDRWQKSTSEDIKPYGKYYTQEIADRVWDFAREEFHEFGYEKDSWKYLDI
jgi:hypothetical protein